MSQYGAGGFHGGGVDLSHLAQRGQQATPAANPTTPGMSASGGAQTVDIPAVVFTLTQENFQTATQLSGVVPVVVNLWSSHSSESVDLNPILETVVRDFKGQLVLAMVEAELNVELVQAFQAQALPAVVALVNGRPVPLFQGSVTEQQIREVFDQLTQLAQQQGLTGRVNAPDLVTDGGTEPVAAPVNPAHVLALEALELGDYATAVTEYESVLKKAPADAEARAALVQVRLLLRLQGKTVDEIRMAAGLNPTDTEAQMLVADLDVSGGHIEDAFLRLLELFEKSSEAPARADIKERLLELFEVVGAADPRVNAARTRLANLLY